MNRAVFVRAVPRGLRGCSLHIYSVVNQDMSGQRAEGGPRLSAALLLLLGTGVLLLCNQFFLGKIGMGISVLGVLLFFIFLMRPSAEQQIEGRQQEKRQNGGSR